MKAIQEKRIFVAYEIGLFLKGLQAFLEVLAGSLLYLISIDNITAFATNIANGELAETPNDTLSHFLIHSVSQLSSSGKFFLAFYLLSHGIIKLIIIVGLFLRKEWAYPAALVGLGGLILYQLYSIVTHYSIFLALFTIMDIGILWLIWREHKVQMDVKVYIE